MIVLVVGSGGREHAICTALLKSPMLSKLYCAPGNGGISRIAECRAVAATDIDGMVAFAQEICADLVMVAPDDPLALGLVDALEAAGIRAFGPRKNAAIIEASKAFSKELMRKYDIPTADYAVFEDLQEALSYIEKIGAPIVIKADGLALGKGVVVAETLEEATAAATEMLSGDRFGKAGQRIVVEEFLSGPECSILAFTDGKTIVPMRSAQDHKRIFDGDLGPNTGGMGAFSPTTKYTSDIAAFCQTAIFEKTMYAMNAEGRTFKGVLYFGLMLTEKGPKVIEYNARFGDPETQAVLMLLETDLLSVFLAVCEERLAELPICWKDDFFAATVVMASAGYPGNVTTGVPISGIEAANALSDVVVFEAGTKPVDSMTVTSGGRVLGVTAVGNSLEAAVQRAYDAVSLIRFDGMQFRTDIGKK